VCCLVIGSTGSYYAFFSCLFIGVASIARLFEDRSYRAAIGGLALTLVIMGVVVAGAIPNIMYQRAHGPNVEVANRQASESEIYGLKITHLLLPGAGHRFPPLAEVGRAYTETSPPLQTENTMATLGLIGGFGFLLLLVLLIVRGRATPPPILWRLAVFNLVAVLFATIGGFASIFALAVPTIATFYLGLLPARVIELAIESIATIL